jgi:hypothetical protein
MRATLWGTLSAAVEMAATPLGAAENCARIGRGEAPLNVVFTGTGGG